MALTTCSPANNAMERCYLRAAPRIPGLARKLKNKCSHAPSAVMKRRDRWTSKVIPKPTPRPPRVPNHHCRVADRLTTRIKSSVAGLQLRWRHMPRYTFHIDNGHRVSSDNVTLHDRKAAQHEAEGIARDLAQNRSSKDKSRVVATDSTGIQVAEAPITHKRK